MIQTAYLTEEQENGKTNIVCKDQNDDLYIFEMTSVGEYKIVLDTYTLNQKKFNDEYAKVTNQKKVMMNIDKFFQMINAKDYDAAYDVLDVEFKNNYFKTVDLFKKFMQENTYLYNKINFAKFDNSLSPIYQYTIIVEDKNNSTSRKSMNIVMQLKEGTDFVMSFSIQ